MKVAWDLDNTIFYNLLAFDFGYYYDRIPLEQFISFNVLNPIVNINDIHIVLTSRYDFLRWITQAQLEHNGIYAEINMYPNKVWTPEKSLKFKINALNKMNADYYVDDDVLFNKLLQPYVKAKCITTDFYYALKNS
jgi:hypothetical protein